MRRLCVSNRPNDSQLRAFARAAARQCAGAVFFAGSLLPALILSRAHLSSLAFALRVQHFGACAYSPDERSCHFSKVYRFILHAELATHNGERSPCGIGRAARWRARVAGHRHPWRAGSRARHSSLNDENQGTCREQSRTNRRTADVAHGDSVVSEAIEMSCPRDPVIIVKQ